MGRNERREPILRRWKMRRMVFWAILLFVVFFSQGAASVKSLSQVFLLNGGLLDADGDHLAEKVTFSIIIPDEPSATEIAVAADIAARANFESLAEDLALVKKESLIGRLREDETLIFIGSRLRLFEKIKAEGKTLLPILGPHQGAVLLLDHSGSSDIAVLGGSEQALLKTGRAFFLRWPYLWEIWGREDGFTYQTLESDLAKFWEERGIIPLQTMVWAALYEFPEMMSSSESLRRLKFDSGEIAELRLKCTFSDRKNKEKARQALEALQSAQLCGEQTQRLNYPGCRRLSFTLSDGQSEEMLSLPRLSYPKRLLTPSYKIPKKRPAQEKTFDLLSLFSDKGLYSDGDKDGLLDGLETVLIISENLGLTALAPFASRLVLPTTGASFPIVYLDKEIEDIEAVPVPCLIGDNRFSAQLIKKGKLKLPPLAKGQAAVQVVPKAFNKTDSLTVVAPDIEGLEKILAYLARTFPHFEDYNPASSELADISADLENFLKGEGGSAEAFMKNKLDEWAEENQNKELESIQVELFLPEENPKFTDYLKSELSKKVKTEKFDFRVFRLRQSQVILEKEKELPWEVEEALALLEKKIKNLHPVGSFSVSLGLSESPAIRQRVKKQVEDKLQENGFRSFEVEVLSAYKPGFFWLTEKILPRLRGKPVASLTIRFAQEKDDLSRPKRFYIEPLRWLQELYPVDEFLARELGLALENIHFEMKPESPPVYEVLALDKEGAALLKESFSPRTRKIPFLKLLPEWGEVQVTTGWLEIRTEGQMIQAELMPTDLERIWEFYQEEVLRPVYAHIMKRTGNKPTTAKQPFFKRLFFELWASEPDYRLGLDEEIISSLEAMHDELYFDTLDFLRGITDIELEEQEAPEDTSRLSAPGNIFPVIHPSIEGGKARAKMIFEDWPAPSPRLILQWKEKGKDYDHREEAIFPLIKPKSTRYPCFVYDGPKNRIENLVAELEFEKERDYFNCLEIVQTTRELSEKNLLSSTFAYPNLKFLTFLLKYKDLEKEEAFPISAEFKPKKRLLAGEPGRVEVSTEEIISPEKCLDIVLSLGGYPTHRAYVAGLSYENREVPVIEVFLPQAKYVSLPRLLTFKPTLFLSARQHANEVSSTNYILKFAELLATDAVHRESLKKMNFVILPMENPDGASLAFELQKLTPFHSLHAGRYGSLGVDIGYQVGLTRPLLPEALVRKKLHERWLPDIYLNLHGYPSHEWVQAFSGYSPYLFRDYWIPRGWFAYFRAPRLPIYEKYREAGEDLRRFLITAMAADEKIRASDEKFYERYRRWASRWQPHLNELELHDGLNVYAARRSSQETKLTPRTKATYIEETPELMDETAWGAWLDFLCHEGLAYLEAHVKYLSQAQFEIGRIDEEIQDRVVLQVTRSRPGRIKKTE